MVQKLAVKNRRITPHGSHLNHSPIPLPASSVKSSNVRSEYRMRDQRRFLGWADGSAVMARWPPASLAACGLGGERAICKLLRAEW